MFSRRRGIRPTTLPGLQIFGRPFAAMPEYFRQISREHGPFVRFRGPFRSVYLIDDPAFIEELFVTRGSSFIKGRGAERLTRLLGRGLLTAKAPVHLVHRRMVQPAFHRNRTGGWADTMTKAARARADAWEPDSEIDVGREMNRLALEIVAEALFGSDLSEDLDTIATTLNDIVDAFPFALVPFSEVFDHLPIPSTLRFRSSKRRLDTIVYRLLREHREAGRDRDDLLSMLMQARSEDGVGLSDVQIRDEAMTILLAGHETTANAMAWAWYLLARHPEVETKLRTHVEDVLGGHDATAEDFARLDYVQAVISETMRLYPPAWITARRALEATTIGPYAVDRGDLVIASQYVTHRNPRFFERPDAFDPERFMGAALPKFAFFPFGGGNRLCIGERFAWMEGVLALATLVQRVRLRPTDDRPIAIQPLVTLRPKTAIRARVTKLPARPLLRSR